jgi:hypothetical protein
VQAGLPAGVDPAFWERGLPSMRARLTFSQINPERFPEMFAIFEESTLPAIRGRPGNRGTLLLTDAAAGKSITVSLWEGDADLPSLQSESGIYREQMAKYLPLFTVPPVREEYVVAVEEWASGDGSTDGGGR